MARSHCTRAIARAVVRRTKALRQRRSRACLDQKISYPDSLIFPQRIFPVVEAGDDFLDTATLFKCLRTDASGVVLAERSFGKFDDATSGFDVKLVAEGFQNFDRDDDVAGRWSFHIKHESRLNVGE